MIFFILRSISPLKKCFIKFHITIHLKIVFGGHTQIFAQQFYLKFSKSVFEILKLLFFSYCIFLLSREEYFIFTVLFWSSHDYNTKNHFYQILYYDTLKNRVGGSHTNFWPPRPPQFFKIYSRNSQIPLFHSVHYNIMI